MYETLWLSLLTNANLPPDWMTIYVGVRGIDLGGYLSRTAYLSLDDVQAFALDALAEAVGTPDEWNIYQVADAPPIRRDAAIGGILRELAKSTGVSVDTAWRKWRYAMIYTMLPRIVGKRRYPGYERDWDVWHEISSDLWQLEDEWGGVCAENPPPETQHLWGDDAEAKWQTTMNAYNEWREREYAAILAFTSR